MGADKGNTYPLAPIGTVNLAPQPISLTMTSNRKELGRFFEKDGVLSFEGDVDESARAFVDSVCETFNDRIKALKNS